MLRLLVLGLICMSCLWVDVDAQAQTPNPGGGTSAVTSRADSCPDSGFYTKGKFISDLCWQCFFPMKIMGVPVPASGRTNAKLPSNTAGPVCVCPGRYFGFPSIGVTWGMWLPTHTMELVRTPWCSPTFGGTVLGQAARGESAGISISVQGGGPGAPGGLAGKSNSVFYQFHWMSFPVGEMMNISMNQVCNRQQADMDYLYFTEFDPTWDNEMLALYTHPEIRAFTKMYAHAVCAADAIKTTVNKPIEQAFWCMGSWGLGYPFSGKSTTKSAVEGQMLAGARGLAAMHRRGLAKKSYGNSAICKDKFWFVFPKHQYQFQNMFPLPEKRQAQWIGTSSWKSGQWRHRPVTGEDRLLVQWSYRECCIVFW